MTIRGNTRFLLDKYLEANTLALTSLHMELVHGTSIITCEITYFLLKPSHSVVYSIESFVLCNLHPVVPQSLNLLFTSTVTVTSLPCCPGLIFVRPGQWSTDIQYL